MRIFKQLGIVIFLITILASCKTSYAPSYIDVEYEKVGDAQVTPDADVESIIVDYRVQLEKEMNVVIGQLEHDLTKERPESDLGNWMADMMHEETNLLLETPVDFSLQNQGGIRVTSVGAGPILVGEIFEVMPFDNKISVLTGTGKDVKDLMDHIAKGRGWPVSRGVSMKIKDKMATEITINGEALDLKRTYRFALPDYIANGGSGSGFLRNLKRQDLDVLIRDVLITHIKKDKEQGITQAPVKEGRIINLDHE